MPANALDRAALDHAVGVATARARAGELPFEIVGVANADGTIRLDAMTAPGAARRIGTNAVCLLASITKPIVATAAMRLVQDGVIGLRAPLADWLPELRDDARAAITPWHVLTHTTGIDEGSIEDLIRDGIDREALVAHVLAMLPSRPLGSQYAYMTLPFELLAIAMERATGEDLTAILRRLVLEPLGMASTAFDPRAAGLADRMAPVTVGSWEGTRLLGSEDPAVAAALVDRYSALRLAGGGLWSTADDLLRFGRAMLRGGELDGERVLSRVFVDLMTRETTVDGVGREANPLQNGAYALGWGKPGVASPASPSAFGHGGKSGTKLWIDPGHDLVYVYLSASWGMPSEVADPPLNAVYGALR
ncbi:MAG: serine hydrolase domain-containing protein [Chloroflexota bacterium]